MTDVTLGGTHDSGKLWGGRFEGGPDPALERLSRSPASYFSLVPEDVRGSIAHLGELERHGVISADEKRALSQALLDIRDDFLAGNIAPAPQDEDIHGFLERVLIERAGTVGGKIRAGRSRNDQTANDLKLWLRRVIGELLEMLNELVEVIIQRSEDAGDAICPGFTHLQAAQPVLFSHQLLAHANTLARDIKRLRLAHESCELSPLGAAALAGSAFTADPSAMAEEMGYAGVTLNSIDAVGSRDHVIDFLYACASIGTNLSRLSDELILWGSVQFGWIKFSDSFATGSSIMPQKKNPDIPELTRGKASRLQSNLSGMLGVMKSVPFSYNRDFSEDKHYAFDSYETLRDVLPALTGFVRTFEICKSRMESQALLGFTLATELADWLAEQGIPFSEAHDITGRAVLFCEQQGCGLEDLTLAQLQQIDGRITDAAMPRLTLQSAVSRRVSSNGTAPQCQAPQRAALRKLVADELALVQGKEDNK